MSSSDSSTNAAAVAFVAFGIEVCGYTRTGGYTRPVPAGTGRVNASRIRVYPLLPVKKVPKSRNY